MVSKAILTTIAANARDMKVSTSGSLLDRLSHHRNGLSTQPPSVPGTVPSKLPSKPPNSATSSAVLQQSWPVSTPLAGMPACSKTNASVPSAENRMWFFPIESRYFRPAAWPTRDGALISGGIGVPGPRENSCTPSGSSTPTT